MLLQGERGCGKTTAARIVAKYILCQNLQDGKVCNTCEMCENIDKYLIKKSEGDTVECVTEINIAKERGIESITKAIEEAVEPPYGYYTAKVLILDESHMATREAQNALLKVTEEPPKHLYIMFCTTDPEKMLPTLRDRCTMKIKVKKAKESELLETLLYGCEHEKMMVSKEALKALIKLSDRNPRQCWNNLETIALSNDNKVTVDYINKYFGVASTEIYMQYFEEANKGIGAILRMNQKIKEQDIEGPDFIRGLTTFVIDCLNVRYGIGLDNYSKEFITHVNKFFGEYTSEELDCLLQIIEYANSFINSSSQNQASYDLVINTTAMRISKLKLLSKGLGDEKVLGEKETRKGASLSLEQFQMDTYIKKDEREVLDNPLLYSVLGKTIAEVTPGTAIKLIEEEDDSESLDEEATINKIMSHLG